jgi:hypothetical protein
VGILLRMRPPPIPVLNTLCSRSAVFSNSVAGVDACFMKEYSVDVHAHPTPSGLDFSWRADSGRRSEDNIKIDLTHVRVRTGLIRSGITSSGRVL